MYLYLTKWELNSLLISYVDDIFEWELSDFPILYVTDIFEWELDDILNVF